MTKKYTLEGLDCAHCAQKIEDAARRVEGVQDVQVSFLQQTLTLTAADAVFDGVFKKVAKACRRVEPDCTIAAN